MSEDSIGAYEQAVDSLVTLVEAFPNEEKEHDLGEADRESLLTSVVDTYASRARSVSDFLTDLPLTEAVVDRILAAAAGDFRLAASLAGAGENWPTEPDVGLFIDEDLSVVDFRDELASLRLHMQEITAAVRGEPEDPEDRGGGLTAPRPEPPNPSAPTVDIPPLNKRSPTQLVDVDAIAGSSELATAPSVEAAGGLVIGGGVQGRPADVDRAIDEILDKAAAQITDLAFSGVTLGFGSFLEFYDWVSGRLPASFEKVQADLTGWVHRAKRAALKLLYEGVEKLLRLMRRWFAPGDLPTAHATLNLAPRFLVFITLTAGRGRVRTALDRMLDIPALRTAVRASLAALPDDEIDGRVVLVGRRRDAYKAKKFPVKYGRWALRAARFVKMQHIAPPYSELAMGAAIIALCATSACLAQDFLDHPTAWYLPDIYRGVRTAVESPLPDS